MVNCDEDRKLQGLLNKIQGYIKEGKKADLIWKINSKQYEYLSKNGINMIPVIYSVKTAKFTCKDVPSIIKQVHRAALNNKGKIHVKLNIKEISELKKYGVKIDPYKYRIFLV